MKLKMKNPSKWGRHCLKKQAKTYGLIYQYDKDKKVAWIKSKDKDLLEAILYKVCMQIDDEEDGTFDTSHFEDFEDFEDLEDLYD